MSFYNWQKLHLLFNICLNQYYKVVSAATINNHLIHAHTRSCHFGGFTLATIKPFLVFKHQYQVAIRSPSYLSENVVSLCLLYCDEAGIDVVIRTQLQADPAVVN